MPTVRRLPRANVTGASGAKHRATAAAPSGPGHSAQLTVLEQQAPRTAGLLTRTRRRLWRARYGRSRDVGAKEPGELVCLDTFYIGNLKGRRQSLADHGLRCGHLLRDGLA